MRSGVRWHMADATNVPYECATTHTCHAAAANGTARQADLVQGVVAHTCGWVVHGMDACMR